MKNATKIIYLICLATLIIAPVVRWMIDPAIELNQLAAFVGAASGPLGVLTGAMAATKISRTRNERDNRRPAE